MGYVSDFSPDGKLFALLDTSDGKLKIWNTKGSRLTHEYVPDKHLSESYTSFVWFLASADKGLKSTENADTTLYIALGTAQGGVDLYSYATNKVESKLKGDGHAGAVTFICLHNESTLYTSGEDCQIVEWSLTKGRKQRNWSIGTITPTCLVSLPKSNSLLVGCRELHLWSLDDYKLKSTFSGHMTDVKSMKMLESTESNVEYVVTTAKSNREIHLWKIGAKKNPKGIFLMEYAASVVSGSIVGSKLMITAVTGADRTAAGGVVHLFIVDDIRDIAKSSSKAKDPMKPTVTITVAFDSGSRLGVVPVPIVAAAPNFSNPKKILIGYGSSPTLRFEDYKYKPDEKKQTLSRDDPRSQVNRESNDHSKTIETKHEKNTKFGTPSKHCPKSMQQRLDALSIGDDEANGKSQVQLLKQALHNGDSNNLRTVLFNKDENVIRSTLKRLPTQYVSILIDELTKLTQKKTANVQIAVRWFKLLLQIHASQLMALGTTELFDRFGSLLGIIEHRTVSLVPLTKLSGRLDFLLNQIKRNTDDDPTFNHENLLVIEEDDEDDSDNGETDENNIEMKNGDDNSSAEDDDFEMYESDTSE